MQPPVKTFGQVMPLLAGGLKKRVQAFVLAGPATTTCF